MIEFYVNNEKIELINRDSFYLGKRLTDRESSGSFQSTQFKPNLLDEFEVYLDNEKIFGGKITEVTTSFQDGLKPIYDVDFQDYTIELQKKVIETFDPRDEIDGGKWTVEEIIDFIIDKYAPAEFDTNNVVAPIELDLIQFNYVTVKECIEELASMVNYDWYVDENRSIHFFEKNTRTAPFDVDEVSGNLFYKTLEITESVEQLKNTIFVRGGQRTSGQEIEQNLNEQIDGDNDQLKTGYTFVYRRDEEGKLIEPVLTKDGVEVDLGIENDDRFDATAAELLTTFEEDNDISYQAQESGEVGNDISVEYVIDSANQNLSSSVTDKKITVYLESNYQSEPRSTANEVVSELQSNTNVTDLVTVNRATGQDGEGIVPTMTETFLEGGQEGKEALYNQDEKVILTEAPFVEGDKPVLLKGRIRIPVQIVVRDPVSTNQYGLEVQHLIVDRSIASTDEAEKKARAELQRFSREIESGSFETHQDGLEPGQVINIQSEHLDISRDFVITSVDMRDDGDIFRYRVGFTTTKSKDLIDLLKKLMRIDSKNIQVSEQEVLARVEDLVETIEWHDDYIEQPLQRNEIVWVTGKYFPDREDNRRVPRTNGGGFTL